MIVSAAISVHASENQIETKTVLVFTGVPLSLGHDAALIRLGLQVGLKKGNRSGDAVVGCYLRYPQKRITYHICVVTCLAS